MGSMIASMGISSTGLAAERLRMDTIANNLANANTSRTAAGTPFRRQSVVFAPRQQGGVQVLGLSEDLSPFREVYEPGNPLANAQGMVQLPNVNVVNEMVDLISATRAYEANITAFNAAKTMMQKALEIGRV